MKTTLLAQKPRILVVSLNPALIQSFKLRVASTTKFEFEYLTINQAHQTPNSASDYYKILGLVSTEEIVHQNVHLLTFLTQFTQPVNLVCFTPASIHLDHQKYRPTNFYFNQEKRFFFLAQKILVTPQIIRGLEIVSNHGSFFPLSSLGLLLQHLDHQVLIQPASRLNYLSLNRFYREVLTILARPHQTQVLLVKNKNSLNSSTFFSKLAKLFGMYHRVEPVIKTTNFKLSLPSQNLVVVNQPDPVSVKNLVERLNQDVLIDLKKQVSLLASSAQSNLQKDLNHQTPIEADQDKTHLSPKQQAVLLDKSEQFNLDVEVASQLTQARNQERKSHHRQIFQAEVTGLKKNRRRRVVFYAGMVLIFFGTLVALLALLFNLNVGLFKHNLRQSLIQALDSQRLDYQLVGTAPLEQQVNLYRVIFANHQLNAVANLVETSQNLNQLALNQSELSRLGEQLLLSIFSLSSPVDSLNLTNSMAQLTRQSTQLVDQALSNLDPFALELGLDESQLNQLTQLLKQTKKSWLTLDQLIPVTTNLLGLSQPREYLVIYQDNNELRPTGGLILAVAKLSLVQGRATNLRVYSAAEIDRRLSGQVEPPPDIRTTLGEERWFFRDAGWGDDVSIATNNVIWFLTKADSRRPDGLIFIDQQALADLLNLVDGVELPSFNERVTADNLEERLLFHVATQSNPESTDYATTLLQTALGKLMENPLGIEKKNTLFQLLARQLQSQHIMLVGFNTSVQSVFDNLAWSGHQPQLHCPSLFNSPDCQVIQVSQTETNIGLNKANHFITRRFDQTITLAPDTIEYHRQIVYHNLAQTPTWPKGDYRALIKLLLPPDAVGVRAYYNQTPLSVEIKRTDQAARASFLIAIPVGETGVVALDWHTPGFTANNHSFLFFDQNQPGSKADPYRLTIINQLGHQPRVVAPTAELQDHQVLFSTIQDKNLLFGLKF